MSKELIRLSDCFMKFDDDVILDHINLYINDKEFLTLLGPSGCGKTTTLRIIGGFQKPTSGDVFFDGVRINDVPPHKRKVNTVFQKYALFTHMNIFENVAFGLRISKVPEAELRERVEEALALVNLAGYGKRSVNSLSGGQQQRVAIARAIVNRPQVLLLDEPLGALDLKLRKDMQIELKRIQQQVGITFVYVTHDQEEALAVSDRIAVMNNGVIQQIDVPSRIYQRPVNQFVSNFIGLSNFLKATIVVQGGQRCLSFQDEPSYRLPMENLKDDVTQGMEVLAAVRPEEFVLSKEKTQGIPAVVQSSVFLGTSTHYFLKLPGGQEVEAVQGTDMWEIIPAGTQVWLGAKAKKINVFTEDGSETLVVREELL